MMQATRPEELLSMAEAGRRLGVSASQVRELSEQGLLEVVSLRPGSRGRVTGRSVMELPDRIEERDRVIRPRSTLEDWRSGKALTDHGWTRAASGALVAPS
jgi:predicted site-specific integrase-resolvase